MDTYSASSAIKSRDIRDINIASIMVDEDVTYEEAAEMLEEEPDLAVVKCKKKHGFYVARRRNAVAACGKTQKGAVANRMGLATAPFFLCCITQTSRLGHRIRPPEPSYMRGG